MSSKWKYGLFNPLIATSLLLLGCGGTSFSSDALEMSSECVRSTSYCTRLAFSSAAAAAAALSEPPKSAMLKMVFQWPAPSPLSSAM
ncbi:hypothetical protein MKX07_004111 [Trichoderma sp. CBMAI-0711]|nr:hypothetical protein MKX07_004111 [Trichoderma sp. CBMAI-0711]